MGTWLHRLPWQKKKKIWCQQCYEWGSSIKVKEKPQRSAFPSIAQGVIKIAREINQDACHSLSVTLAQKWPPVTPIIFYSLQANSLNPAHTQGKELYTAMNTIPEVKDHGGPRYRLPGCFNIENNRVLCVLCSDRIMQRGLASSFWKLWNPLLEIFTS